MELRCNPYAQLALCAIGAEAAQFDHRPHVAEARRLARSAQGAGDPVVVEMAGSPAIVADQEHAVVAAPGVGVDEEGVGAFDPVGEVVGDEDVENAVDAVGRDAAAAAGVCRRASRTR